MKTKHLEAGFEFKALAEDGTFSGYASVFGVLDSYDEVVDPTAFDEWMKTSNRMPAMLAQHDRRVPVGVFKSVTVDERGLYVEGKFTLDATAGRDYYAYARDGAISGLSIGYVLTGWKIDETTKVTHLTAVDLKEISLVTFPANDQARISAVKGDTPTERETEHLLRDAGFSRAQAKAIVSGGYKAADGLRDAGYSAEAIQKLVNKIKEATINA